MKTLCQVKEARYKRPYLVLFHLYKIYRIGESIETKRKLVVRGWGEEEMGIDCWLGMKMFCNEIVLMVA